MACKVFPLCVLRRTRAERTTQSSTIQAASLYRSARPSLRCWSNTPDMEARDFRVVLKRARPYHPKPVRQLIVSILVAASLLGSMAARASPVPPASLTATTVASGLLQQLLAANREFVSALKAHDVARLHALTSPTYVAVDPYFPYMLQGPNVLADELAAWDDYFHPHNGDEILLRTESQPRIKRYGNVAVLAYVEIEGVKTKAQRVRAGRTAKCTFVYVLQNHKWLLVNSHISPQAWPDRTLIGSSRRLDSPLPEEPVTGDPPASAGAKFLADDEPNPKQRTEILAAGEKFGAAANNTDLESWAAMLVHDYTEFDPYFPFLLEISKDTLISLQQVWVDHDKLPYGFGPTRFQRIQMYENVAILTVTNVTNGRLVGGGFLDQGKSTLVYVKVGGSWLLTHCHDGRRAGPDGIPID